MRKIEIEDNFSLGNLGTQNFMNSSVTFKLNRKFKVA
jgi:hypothetical protein